jgi:prepilin peptidase CpaA
MSIIATVLTFAFCLGVIFGALTDLSRYQIPNAVSYGLVLLFVPLAILNWAVLPIGLHVLIGVVVFVLSVIFWQLRWMGGGDVKFLSAIALWMGPDRILVFLILVTVVAVVFISILKFLLRWNDLFQAGRYPAVFKQLLQKSSERKIPYGLPIGIAALVSYFMIAPA